MTTRAMRLPALALALATLLGGCAGTDGGALPGLGSFKPVPIVTVPSAPPVPASAPNGVSGPFLAGKLAEDRHDFLAAADLYAVALQADPGNGDLLARRTICLAAAGDIAAATDASRGLHGSDAQAYLAQVLQAEQLTKAGDWSGVEAVVATMSSRGFPLLLAPLLQAWSKAGEGDIDAALSALKPLETAGGLAVLYDFNVALIDDFGDRADLAAAAYEKTLAEPGGMTLQVAEAAVAFFRRVNAPEKAYDVLQRFHSAHPETSFDGGQAGVRAVATPAEGIAAGFFSLAGSVRGANAVEVVLLFNRLALDLRPDFPLAQILLSDQLQSIGDLEGADHALNAISRASPLYWAGQLRVADNLDAMGHFDPALAILTSVSAQFPKRPEPAIAVGELLRRHEKWADAIQAYDRAIAELGPTQPGHWYVFYARGVAEERSNQWEKAEADFRKSLEIQPDEAQVLNYLGYSWIEKGVHLDQAKEMIEAAVKLRPNDGAIVDSLGWALFRTGDYDHAVEILERAVELEPSDPTVTDHFGDALWRVGRRSEAHFQWSHALLYQPDDGLKAALERKLKIGLKPLPEPAVAHRPLSH